MRLTVYNQINELIDTLMEAVNYMANSDDLEVITQLLEDSHLVLESIDSSIMQNSESVANPVIIEHLTKCKDLVLELEDNSLMIDSCKLQKLDNDIKQLQIMFKEHVQYKYRVVFFAELGQKWDAMNSVYEAFKEREDCEAIVVLTPIFRRVNLNGEVKTDVIYEDYLTELGIDFIGYKQYDLSKDLPDMAFITNPYESVTLPEFWPENIAKYTRLVYIPYYTNMSLNGTTIQTESQLPFIDNAWKIIVQSEEVKTSYQRYSNSAKDNFLVAGLPKWDELFKVMEAKNSDILEWERLKGKKTFLWNVHYNVSSEISTLLNNGKDILNIFKNRDDIALIFRPHPMIETIFKLYQPEYLSYWEEIKSSIKKSQNMVLDNNSSYKSAFAYSDALLSEYSSILNEYAFLRKPMLWLKKKATDEFIKGLRLPPHITEVKSAYTREQIEEFIDELVESPEIALDYIKSITRNLPNSDGRNGEQITSILIKNM